MVMVYYSTRIKTKSAKGKAHEVRSKGNQVLDSRFLSQKSHTECTSMIAHVKCGQPGKLIRTSASRVFTGG